MEQHIIDTKTGLCSDCGRACINPDKLKLQEALNLLDLYYWRCNCIDRINICDLCKKYEKLNAS